MARSTMASRRFAGALRAAGVARERRVALLLLDTVDFPIAFWGAIRAGVVPVPINTLLTAREWSATSSPTVAPMRW